MDTPTNEKLNIAAAQYAHANDDYGDLFTLLYNTFVAGAEWQKKQTSEQAMKYLQEHHSPSEVSDFQAAMNIAVAKAIDNTINKSIEWLKENHHKYTSWDTIEYELNFNTDTLIEDLKKDMEE